MTTRAAFFPTLHWSSLFLLVVAVSELPALAADQGIRVTETEATITVETDALSAVIAKEGYVSGIKGGSFIDKKTGAHDLGFGLHVQDWLMAPGWREGDDYARDPKVHGNLPKHLVEGPQLCTQAKKLPAEIIRGKDFVAVKLTYRYTQPGAGYEAGSTWEQTILFQPAVRFVLTSERITSRNTVDDLFYRLDMPGHIRHSKGDDFVQVYLSYIDKMIPAAAFDEDFGPDEKFLYQRNDAKVPQRMIRAYQVKLDAKPGPWLAGMTLDPAEVAEAWCHQRGYVCFIEELHRRPVDAGESFGAAYVIGWFDGVAEMERVYDKYKGAGSIWVGQEKFSLEH